MDKIFFHLIESSLLLALFYSVYYFLLRKEGSLQFNRFYLLASLLLSLVYPLLNFDFQSETIDFVNKPVKQLSEIRSGYQDELLSWAHQPIFPLEEGSMPAKNESNALWTSLRLIYFLGMVFFLGRLIWITGWIYRLKASNSSAMIHGVNVIKVKDPIAPFSFFNSAFVNMDMTNDQEVSRILDHELTHIKQKHSLDLFFVQLLASIMWFNPVIWWLIKSLKTTHEYIADRKMIKKGYSLVEYQSLLLKQLISNNSLGLVHHFNLSFIKKRITMMKTQKAGSLGKTKVAFATIVAIGIGFIAMQCNSKLDSQLAENLIDNEVTLPIIEYSGYQPHLSSEDDNVITIKNDEIYLNGEKTDLSGLDILSEISSVKTFTVMRVDQNQAMGLVNAVQEKLKDLDRRKLLYEAQLNSGDVEQVAFMMPPSANSNSRIKVPVLTPEFIEENGIHMVEINMNDLSGDYKGLIYSMLNDPMVSPGSLVVRGIYTEKDTFGAYLATLQQMKQGFYKLYDERAQEMFGKGFMEINSEQKTSEAAKQQYRDVREGIPMAIVVDMI